jgi:hypothetical protein
VTNRAAPVPCSSVHGPGRRARGYSFLAPLFSTHSA